MTVQQLIKILKQCPQDAPVIIRYESNEIDIGTSWSPIFIDKECNVCLFQDTDEANNVLQYLKS